MKMFMPQNEKISKPNKPNVQLSRSFLKQSKSEIFFTKKHKKSTSPSRQKLELSKNDQRIPIYTDSTGFIVDYAILPYIIKCEGYLTQTVSKKSSKTLKLQSIQLRQNIINKKSKLQMTLDKNHISVIKGGVQHIFSLPQQSKYNFIKIVLTQNWQIQQFTIPNKKAKILKAEALPSLKDNLDYIYPLKNIMEADEMRKIKLSKSDSKIKIAWASSTKDNGDDKSQDFKRDILSFSSQRLFGDLNKSVIIGSSKQFPRTAFLRKSFNECDQTCDSEEQDFPDTNHIKNIYEKQSPKQNKTLHINLSQWKLHPSGKDDFMGLCRKQE